MAYAGGVPGLEFLDEELAALRARGRLRSLRTREGRPGRRVWIDGRWVSNFSANDYLGLTESEDVARAAAEAATELGSGAGASRLIVGNHSGHEDLEAALARWQGREAALVFNSGYQANTGVVGALAGRDDVIVSDALNHASLIDGCRLSRSEVAVYRHGDAEHAEELLASRGKVARRRFIVTDAVFSMDGDAAPLDALAEVARRQRAVLIVDEAHSVGVFGARGAGLGSLRGVVADVHVGTFGKAFGSFGAYVAGTAKLREVLLSRARSFVFSTGLPPAVVAASRAALSVVEGRRGDELRDRLWERIGWLKHELAEMGVLCPGAGDSPIFPVLVGGEAQAMECCERLFERGLYVQGIRPPTVPRGTSRLRIAVMASHEAEDMEMLVNGLDELRERGMLPDPSDVLGADEGLPGVGSGE